jgi:hypothetical protein
MIMFLCLCSLEPFLWRTDESVSQFVQIINVLQSIHGHVPCADLNVSCREILEMFAACAD